MMQDEDTLQSSSPAFVGRYRLVRRIGRIQQYKVIGVKGSYSTGMLHIAAEIKRLLLS